MSYADEDRYYWVHCATQIQIELLMASVQRVASALSKVRRQKQWLMLFPCHVSRVTWALYVDCFVPPLLNDLDDPNN